MEIRLAKLEDLPSIAACHMLAFPATMMAKLGVKFVVKALECYVRDANKFLTWIAEDGVCAGYISGILVSETSLGSASSMLQSGLVAGIEAIVRKPRLLLEPELRAKLPLVGKNLLLRLMRRKQNHVFDRARPAGYRSAGVPGICVHPGYRRRGYATELLLAAERVALERGFRHMHLEVLASNTAMRECTSRIGYTTSQVNPTSLKLEKALA